MSDLRPYLWLIPGLPMAASALTAFLGPRILRRHSHWPCILAVAGSFFVSLIVFFAVYSAGEEAGNESAIVAYAPWIQVSGAVDIGFTLRADALTAMMLVMITFIGGFIAIYAAGYMHDDPGYPRFFAEVALFITSMTVLVLADNFILLYAGWEGVGLCSYLLIGFWFSKESAAAAARKAFLVTRIGDVGLFLGILLLWFHYGSMEYKTIFDQISTQSRDTGLANAHQGVWLAAALLLFCGAAGKSAQFPLYVWLPDAMEGPTPVSALIHAATMVTAGVYLVARCTPLFMAVPDAQLIVACIGGFTSILAALIALTQNDLKRVLAYSTLSQLGYMFLALGCAITAGGKALVTFAVTAAMFHLFTHAFFKALLFLAAGSVMHAMGGVIDMRRFSGLWRKMPRTHWTFLCGSLALAGVFPLSGFWSKDEILDAVARASHDAHGSAASIYQILLVSGVVTAGLTAFYTFRAYFKTFLGPEKIPPEAGSHGHDAADAHGGDHGGHGSAHGRAKEAHKPHGPGVAHESPAVMTIPLIVLSIFAVGVGFLLGPLGPPALHISEFLARTPYFPHSGQHEHEMNWLLMGVSTVVALGGIALAWLMYVKQPDLPGKAARSAQLLYRLSLNKFYIDELYIAVIVQPAQAFAKFLGQIDLNGVDATVDLIGQIPRHLGGLFRPVQNGLVQFYALAMILGLTVFLLALVRSL